MVERDRRTFQALERNATLLGCESVVALHCADGMRFAGTTQDSFDVVFLDPPYMSGLITAIMPVIPRLLRPGGVVYVESAAGLALDAPWREHRKGTAGHVTFQLFRHGDQ